MVNIFHCLWKAESSILSILAKYGYVAQLVEHETENLGVGGSIPPVSTIYAMIAE